MNEFSQFLDWRDIGRDTHVGTGFQLQLGAILHLVDGAQVDGVAFDEGRDKALELRAIFDCRLDHTSRATTKFQFFQARHLWNDLDELFLSRAIGGQHLLHVQVLGLKAVQGFGESIPVGYLR